MKSNYFGKKALAFVFVILGLSLGFLFQNCSGDSELEGYSGLGSVVPSGPPPSDLLCVYSKSLNGPATQNFNVGEVAYGKCTGFGASGVKGCIEIVGTPGCDDLGDYTALPNPASAPYDWKYLNGDYVAQFTIPSTFGGKRFISHTYNGLTDEMADPVFLAVAVAVAVAAPPPPAVTCQWQDPTVAGPCTRSPVPYACTTTTAGQIHTATCGAATFTSTCVCN